MKPLTIGSACSGAGALDLAVERVLGATPAWFCEWDDAPSKVLAHHWPGVPNYRDLTTVDWATVPPIDVYTAGYPCQPFSAAGKRLGTDDERHLWPFILVALNTLRPRWAVFENVAGHLTLGFDVVLGDLAADGWYVRWFVCRASDIGAPHHRKRVFIMVSREPWPVPTGAREIARHDGTDWHEPDAGLFGAIPFTDRWPNAGCIVNGIAYEVDTELAARTDLDVLPTPTTQPMTGNGHARHLGGEVRDMLPTPTASNPNDTEDVATWEARRAQLAAKHGNNGAGMPLGVAVRTLPTPTASDADKARDNPAQAARHSPPLSAVTAHFPTPRAAEHKQSLTAPAARQHVADGNGGLTEVLGAHLFPTPMVSDAANPGPADTDRNSPQLRAIDAFLPTPEAKLSHAGPDYARATRPGAGGDDLITTLHRLENENAAPEGRPGEVLQGVRGIADATAVRERTPGGPELFPATGALQPELREHESERAGGLAPLARAAVREAQGVRGVRDDGETARPSHRPEPGEQPAGEPANPVRVVPPETALAGGPSGTSGGVRWGKYEPAIRRWEGVLGRPAPAPTELNSNARPRLSARFAEFLMGWQGGHVTDPAIGLTRPEQLKIIGNGVVDRQAEHAIRTMLSWDARDILTVAVDVLV